MLPATLNTDHCQPNGHVSLDPRKIAQLLTVHAQIMPAPISNAGAEPIIRPRSISVALAGGEHRGFSIAAINGFLGLARCTFFARWMNSERGACARVVAWLVASPAPSLRAGAFGHWQNR